MGQQYLQRGKSFFQGTLHKRTRAVRLSEPSVSIRSTLDHNDPHQRGNHRRPSHQCSTNSECLTRDKQRTCVSLEVQLQSKSLSRDCTSAQCHNAYHRARCWTQSRRRRTAALVRWLHPLMSLSEAVVLQSPMSLYAGHIVLSCCRPSLLLYHRWHKHIPGRKPNHGETVC